MSERTARLESSLKVLASLVALIGLFWGMFTYFDSKEREFETRRLEATRPFLERQLELYTHATRAAATLAASEDAAARAAASKRFWELYWGELALVEDQEVERAMVALGRGLRNDVGASQLQQMSLNLAHACRESLAKSWGVGHWARQQVTPTANGAAVTE